MTVPGKPERGMIQSLGMDAVSGWYVLMGSDVEMISPRNSSSNSRVVRRGDTGILISLSVTPSEQEGGPPEISEAGH